MSISMNIHGNVPAVQAHAYKEDLCSKGKGWLRLDNGESAFSFHALTPEEIIDLGGRIRDAGFDLDRQFNPVPAATLEVVA